MARAIILQPTRATCLVTVIHCLLSLGGRGQSGGSDSGLRRLRAEEHAGPRQLHHREGEGPGEQ